MGARPGNNATLSGLPIITPSSTPTSLGVPSEASIQPYSCLQCKHRKVKCDRIDPCIHCRKAGAECIYRAPPPPKRRKRGQQDAVVETPADSESHDAVVSPRDYVVEREDLLDKIRRYESMLKDLGALKRSTVGVKERDSVARTPESTMDGDGKLITKYGKSRYLENVLWTSVRDEFSDPDEILEDLSDNNIDGDDGPENDTVGTGRPTVSLMAQDPLDLVFPPAATKSTLDVRSLHPRPVQIFMLWQAFVDNVNPIIKLFHVPTMQKAVLEATSDLGHVSKAIEALLFGIYLIAVLSMEDAECQSTLHQSKAAALDRFRTGAQEALRAAGILRTSDMMVLQAFVLFLLAARCDAHSLWALTGISIRIGQRIGLHRDGDTLKLPPFETEMRRRLWLIMVQLDCRAAELSGSGLSIITLLGHTKPPLNVNDCDLYPDMSEPPTEQTKATEMMFILIRSTIGSFLIKEMPENEIFDGVWSTLSNPAVSIIAKDNVINELEATLEDKVVRHCDLQVPLHHLSFLVARSAICKLRLFAHLPRDAGDSPATKTSPEEEDLLFNNSLRMLQYDTEIRSTKTLRRFLWHADMHFQWHALIYLLTYLRAHGESNARTDTAWATIDGIFANHPEIIHGGQTRSKLCIAVGSLTLKAWEARESGVRRSNPPGGSPNPPSCVRQLRGQQLGLQLGAPDTAEVVIPSHRVDASTQHQRHHSNGATGLQADHGGGFGAMMASSNAEVAMSANESDMIGSYATPITWGQWDSMCQEFEMQSQWTTGFGPLDMFPQQQ